MPFHEVRIVHKRTSFERLLAIARRPHIARHVRSLVYQADIFRVYYGRHGESPNKGLFGMDSDDIGEAVLLKDDFWAYRQLCEDQLRMRRESFDLERLSRFFARCSGLDEVKIAYGPNEAGNEKNASGFPDAAFREHRAPMLS